MCDFRNLDLKSQMNLNSSMLVKNTRYAFEYRRIKGLCRPRKQVLRITGPFPRRPVTVPFHSRLRRTERSSFEAPRLVVTRFARIFFSSGTHIQGAATETRYYDISNSGNDLQTVRVLF